MARKTNFIHTFPTGEKKISTPAATQPLGSLSFGYFPYGLVIYCLLPEALTEKLPSAKRCARHVDHPQSTRPSWQLAQIETISNRELASRDIKIDCDCASNDEGGGFELKCTSWPQPPQWRCNSVTQSFQHMSPNELTAATPHDIAHAGLAHIREGTYTHTHKSVCRRRLFIW